MRPKIRKVNTNKRKKERKLAQERLQKQTAAFLDHPKECCVCNTPFERTRETVKTWQVVTRENRVRLTCPDCWDKVEGIVEIKNEDK
jgi:hypothetical protein